MTTFLLCWLVGGIATCSTLWLREEERVSPIGYMLLFGVFVVWPLLLPVGIAGRLLNDERMPGVMEDGR